MSDTKTSVRAIEIKAKKRPDIDIDYDGTKYRLTGRIPTELMTISAQNKAPRNPTKESKSRHEQELGAAMIDAFYSLVIPDDFKNILDMEDVAQVFEVWAEHVGLGESKDSSN
jgi:hypothetical protein